MKLLEKINVAIYQPIIPSYRVPLFNALSKCDQVNLIVFASRRIYGFQKSTHDELYFKFIPVSGTGFGKGFFWQSNLRIPSHFKNGDVIVVNGMLKFLNLYLLILTAKLKKLGLVLWGHGFSGARRGLRVWIRQQIMKFADIILFYTEREVEEYQLLGFSANRLFATNNTINTTEIEVVKNKWVFDSVEKFKKKHGIVNTKNILYCGRLTKKSKIEIAVKALAKIVSQDSTYRLIVIGDGPEKLHFESKVKELNISNSVIWLGTIYNNYELAPWFLSSFVFVFPGNIGLSLLHAFAFGLPVITHDHYRLHGPEVSALKDGINGYVFRYGDSDDLACKIRRLFFNKDIRAKMAENAYLTVRSKFTFPKMVERYLEAIIAASNMSKNKR